MRCSFESVLVCLFGFGRFEEDGAADGGDVGPVRASAFRHDDIFAGAGLTVCVCLTLLALGHLRPLELSHPAPARAPARGFLPVIPGRVVDEHVDRDSRVCQQDGGHCA